MVNEAQKNTLEAEKKFKQEYYIICLDSLSFQRSLLFWRDNAQGYTPNIEKAGLFSEKYAKDINEAGHDLALSKEELFKIKGTNIMKIMECSLIELKIMKKNLKK